MATNNYNACQYWHENEPGRCSHWDNVHGVCTNDSADYYPACNAIGTQFRCEGYNGSGSTPRCVLPDPDRHVVDRKTGEAWAVLATVGNFTTDYSKITEYNGGQCDGYGTSARCTGYSPYHMAFSSYEPSEDYDEGEFTNVSGGGMVFRLPLGYVIYNKRALLSRCYWWKDDPIEFTINESTGQIEPIEFKCTLTSQDPIVTNYNGFRWDYETGMFRAPCNGAKPECPHYTGICWQHCTDEKMKHGDKVLAEQILELRYYIRKEDWTEDEFYDSFRDPEIQAWSGEIRYEDLPDGNTRGEMGAIRTFVEDFDVFTIGREKTILTEGLRAEDYKDKFPTLVREIQDITLAPIIRNEFDQYNNENIFEVTDLYHEDILVFGDVFYYGHYTYALNLSDKDIDFLPRELKIYDSMSEIEVMFSDEEGFTDFQNNLDCMIDFMLENMPNKIFVSSLGLHDNMFYIDVNTFFGANEIIVLNKGSGRWELDKVSFKKIFCGGVIGQTKFEVTGRGEIDYLPAYDRDFTSYVNNNGRIEFQFFPMVSMYRGDTSFLHYVYNDSVRKRLPADLLNIPDFDTYSMSYKLFRIIAYSDLELGLEDMKVFGNAGYIMVTIPDDLNLLSNVIKPWEVGGKFRLVYEDGSVCEMEMYDREANLDKLEVNQVIIKPKSSANFNSICLDTVLSIPYIYVYERRSFGQEPELVDGNGIPLSYEEVAEEFISEDDVVDDHDYTDAQLQQAGTYFTLTKFGYEALTISAVFKGITGRVKGHIKTKMITWVRQPYCRDVEINYEWSAIYDNVKLIPEYNCYGEIDEVLLGSVIQTYTPPCGDHNLGFFSDKGPMWYPYIQCDNYARYDINGVNEFDNRIMEVFWENYVGAYDAVPHSRYDIRMLGPADMVGYTCGTHAHLWDCLCDWSFCNYYKKNLNKWTIESENELGDVRNYFVGYARYRGGMSYADKVLCVRNGGTLPKFGNTYRDFLRTYRSMDNVDYYYWDGDNYIRLLKWVPMYEYYTSANITKPIEDYLYLTYSSNDYYDDGSSFVHPMGLMLVDGALENVFVHEKIDIDSTTNKPARYRFEDVFESHSCGEAVYYPYLKNPSQRLSAGALIDAPAWYTYRDYPGDAGPYTTYSIQWAWQEVWADLERQTVVKESIDDYLSCATRLYKGVHPVVNSEDVVEAKVISPYTFAETGDYVEGKHLFLDVNYPDYTYDYKLEEHRLVCDEGEHEITIDPPEVDEYGEYPVPFWIAVLDLGPGRCFDVDAGWEPDPEPMEGDCTDYRNLYETCTESPWKEDVTLFATGYTDSSTTTAENEGRYIEGYDDIGTYGKSYYQRGLDVYVDSTKFTYIPRSLNKYDSLHYEVEFSETPDCMSTSDFSNWEALESGEWYDADYNFDLVYCVGDNKSLNVDFMFKVRPEPGATNDLDTIKMSIGAIKISFGFGLENMSEGLDRLRHIPGIIFYKGDSLLDLEEVASYDIMYLSSSLDTSEDVEFIYEFNNDVEEILEGHSYFRIAFRMDPTADEKEDVFEDYLLNSNVVKLNSIRLYYDKFEQAIETINTYERKYHISYGRHGDFPPHGYDSTGSLLYPIPNDKSSVYQYDTVNGMVGMSNTAGDNETINKCRGRIMKACHPDKESLGGGDIYDWEEEQETIYKEIAINSGDTDFNMVSTVPPGLQDKLDEIGVAFPAWACSFVNTLIRPLVPVRHYDQYSPHGHYFGVDTSNLTHRYDCGRHGFIFGRTVADVFEYKYYFAYEDEAMWDQVDVIVAYNNRVSRLFGRLLESSMDSPISDVTANIVDSYYTAGKLMDLPEAVKVLY